MDDSNHIELQLTIAAPLDVVWRALRDPVQIRRWFGWDYENLDAEIEQIFVTGAEVDETAHALDFGDDQVELTAHDDDSTILRVTRPAPAGASGWDDGYDEISQGWLAFFEQLRFALERHPGQERHTLRLEGASVGAAPPAEQLGVAESLPGSSYDSGAAPGERLVGEVWFRGQHQLGLTVGAYGDGLIVLTAKPAGGAAATITIYGLSAADVTHLEQAWQAWWGERYPADAG